MVEAIALILEQEAEIRMGGDGLCSSVGDYLEFIRMILNKGASNGERVLKPETVATMSVNHIGDCRVRARPEAIGWENRRGGSETRPRVEVTASECYAAVNGITPGISQVSHISSILAWKYS